MGFYRNKHPDSAYRGGGAVGPAQPAWRRGVRPPGEPWGASPGQGRARSPARRWPASASLPRPPPPFPARISPLRRPLQRSSAVKGLRDFFIPLLSLPCSAATSRASSCSVFGQFGLSFNRYVTAARGSSVNRCAPRTRLPQPQARRRNHSRPPQITRLLPQVIPGSGCRR